MPAVIPKKTRDDVYRFLFTEGVIALKKDRMQKWEGQLGGQKFSCPVHSVWVLLNSFKSRGYVNEQFAWRHFYWTLNDEGVEYLRKYLHLAESVVPNTQKKSQKEGDERQFERRPAGQSSEGRGRGRGGEGRGRGAGRGGYGSDRAAYQTDRPRGCFNCGQEGHRADACTNEKVERPQSDRPRGCFNCGQEGHRASDCTNEKVERPAGRGRGAAGGRGRGCFNCGQEGHRAADCSNPKAEAPAAAATEAAPAPTA